MPEVIKVREQNKLVQTSSFKYAKFPFEEFNCVQSRVFEYADQDVNMVIAAKTGTGKTYCAEMFLSYEVRKRGGKGMYLAPLKALASEKSDDWTDESHHFYDQRVSICTGDYLLTPKRKEELDAANLVVMSCEMLNSRCRNAKSESSKFLTETKTLVVDEAHLLTVPGRGDHLENGIVKYSKMNPNGRLVFLSATMPNVDQIGGWLSKLNGKTTIVLESDFRPVPLYTHYEKYDDDAYGYDGKEDAKCWKAMSIIDSKNEEKFLVFGHTKRTVKIMYDRLKKAGYVCEMHTADLDKNKRREVEERFKHGKLQGLVATSTLAWGVNTPARNVIVLGMHSGMREVPKYDCDQMCGRAGRPGYDTEGHAHILLPASNMADHIHRLQKPQNIESQLFNVKNPRCAKVLAFHLVSEIHHQDVKTRAEVKDWFADTLAAYQNKNLDEAVVENTVTDLLRCGAIKEEEGVLKATYIGKIASLFYYSPFDVSDLCKNFSRMFKEGKEENDYWIAASLGWMDTHKFNIVSNAEKEEIAGFEANLIKSGAAKALAPNGWRFEGATKAAYGFFCCLRGIYTQTFLGFTSGLKYDCGRVKQVLQSLDAMGAKWGKKDWLIQMEQRIRSGVPVHLIDVARLEGISKVKGQKLFDHGLTSLKEVAGNVPRIIQALSCTAKAAEKIANNAKELLNAEG
jgi:replicative superfamily II helicase